MSPGGADAVIIVLSVSCIGGLLCAVFLKRKAIASKFRRPAAPPAQTAEVQVPLQAPNPDPQDVSMVPMPGSAESGAFAGIQEQQGAECPAESNSWRILPQAPSTPSKRNAQHPGVKSPVQVSMEGNSEAIHFALPGSKCVFLLLFITAFLIGTIDQICPSALFFFFLFFSKYGW